MCRARKACDCDSVDDEALLLLGLWLRMDRVARGLDSTVLRVGTLSRMSCCHQTSASHQSERAVVCRAFAKARGRVVMQATDESRDFPNTPVFLFLLLIT